MSIFNFGGSTASTTTLVNLPSGTLSSVSFGISSSSTSSLFAGSTTSATSSLSMSSASSSTSTTTTSSSSSSSSASASATASASALISSSSTPSDCFPSLDPGLSRGSSGTSGLDRPALEPYEALTIADSLALIAGRKKFADVTFIVGRGSSARALYGHRCILASASDIFEAMLYPPIFPDEDSETRRKMEEAAKLNLRLHNKKLKQETKNINDVRPLDDDEDDLFDESPEEKKPSGKDERSSFPYQRHKKRSYADDLLTVHLPELNASAFQLTLQLLYSDSVSICAEDLPHLMVIANRFHLSSLRALISEFIEEGVTLYNALTLFSLGGELLGDGEVALRFIEENAADIFQSVAFETLRKDRVKRLLQSDRLQINETSVFQSVLRWANAQLKRDGKRIDDMKAKKSVLDDVIPLIRFPLMSSDEITSLVAPTQLLTDEQLVSVLAYVGQMEEGKLDKDKQAANCGIFSCVSREGEYLRWTLHPTQKANCDIYNDNHSARNNTSGTHSYCMGDKELTKGQYAWRIYRDSGAGQWMLVGVCRPQTLATDAYSSTHVWAMSSQNQLFMAGVQTTITSNFATGPVDVVFDTDARTLKILNLHSNPPQSHIISNIPTGPMVPLFSPHSVQSISVYAIPTKQVGNKIFVPKEKKA